MAVDGGTVYVLASDLEKDLLVALAAADGRGYGGHVHSGTVAFAGLEYSSYRLAVTAIALGIAAALLGEKLGALDVVGVVVIAAGILMVQLSKQKAAV